MNLVEAIQQEISGPMLNKLSSMTGLGEAKTKSAVGAAVPVILSGLGKMAGMPGGAEKIAAMARKFTPGELSDIPDLTSTQAGTILEEGKNAMTGLFGSDKLNLMMGILQKFLSTDPAVLKKLLSVLGPIIFGAMTKKFGVNGLTGSTVSALFEEQKGNIANAMPAGLSLDAFPDFGKDAAASGSGLLLPLVLLFAVAAGVYWWFIVRPQQQGAADKGKNAPGIQAVLPEVTAFTKGLDGVVGSLTETLNTVKDAATADAALPKLKDASQQAGGLKDLLDKVPGPGKAAAKAALDTGLGKLKVVIEKILALPGVGEKLKPILDEIVGKLTGLGA